MYELTQKIDISVSKFVIEISKYNGQNCIKYIPDNITDTSFCAASSHPLSIPKPNLPWLYVYFGLTFIGL